MARKYLPGCHEIAMISESSWLDQTLVKSCFVKCGISEEQATHVSISQYKFALSASEGVSRHDRLIHQRDQSAVVALRAIA